MSVMNAVLYGIIQGLAEFLPISSSGHLAIFANILGMEDLGSYMTFELLLHLGTLVAVFIVFYRDIFVLVPAFFGLISKVFGRKFKKSDYSEDERFVLYIIIATLPLALAFFVKDRVEMINGYTKAVGAILIFNGLVLLASDMISKGEKTVENTTPFDALFVGLCQMCALLPGLSRSGSTITGGLFMGFKREYAVRFSFILSIPAIIGANIFSVADVLSEPVAYSDMKSYIVGTLVAAAVGIIAMKLLIYISKKSNFRFFAYYCFAAGLIAVIFG